MTAFVTSRTSVSGSSASQLASWTRGPSPFYVLIENSDGGEEMYVGPTGSVTQTTGYYVGPGAVLRIDVPAGEPGVAAGTEEVWAITQVSGSVEAFTLVQPS